MDPLLKYLYKQSRTIMGYVYTRIDVEEVRRDNLSRICPLKAFRTREIVLLA